MAKYAVVAVPPRVAAARVAFTPPLPDAQLARMSATATWAGDWCKVVASFKTPFWRKNGGGWAARVGSRPCLFASVSVRIRVYSHHTSFALDFRLNTEVHACFSSNRR